MVFSANHDQVGNRAFGDRLPARAHPLAAFCTLLAPFTPMLFQGEEYGERAPFQFFSDHIDPEIADATREGRRREFASFSAFSGHEVPDPQDPETWDSVFAAARHQLSLFVQRCRYACKKQGIALRYLGFPSDLHFDGRAQDYVHTRIHHHLIVNPEAAELCKRCWRLGAAGDRPMKKTADHTDLACYLMDQCRRIDERKKYVPARNLCKPLERTPRISCSSREVQPPKGAILLYRSPFEVGRPQYIRYILPKWARAGLPSSPGAMA